MTSCSSSEELNAEDIVDAYVSFALHGLAIKEKQESENLLPSPCSSSSSISGSSSCSRSIQLYSFKALLTMILFSAGK